MCAVFVGRCLVMMMMRGALLKHKKKEVRRVPQPLPLVERQVWGDVGFWRQDREELGVVARHSD
jgi:hypothetical protein